MVVRGVQLALQEPIDINGPLNPVRWLWLRPGGGHDSSRDALVMELYIDQLMNVTGMERK